jgi:hypothetical protein
MLNKITIIIGVTSMVLLRDLDQVDFSNNYFIT